VRGECATCGVGNGIALRSRNQVCGRWVRGDENVRCSAVLRRARRHHFSHVYHQHHVWAWGGTTMTTKQMIFSLATLSKMILTSQTSSNNNHNLVSSLKILI